MPPPSWACLPLCSHPTRLGCHRALAWVPCVIFFIISPTACCKGLTGELSVNFILSRYSQVQSSPVFTYYWQATRLSNLGPTELKNLTLLSPQTYLLLQLFCKYGTFILDSVSSQGEIRDILCLFVVMHGGRKWLNDQYLLLICCYGNERHCSLDIYLCFKSARHENNDSINNNKVLWTGTKP